MIRKAWEWRMWSILQNMGTRDKARSDAWFWDGPSIDSERWCFSGIRRMDHGDKKLPLLGGTVDLVEVHNASPDCACFTTWARTITPLRRCMWKCLASIQEYHIFRTITEISSQTGDLKSSIGLFFRFLSWCQNIVDVFGCAADTSSSRIVWRKFEKAEQVDPTSALPGAHTIRLCSFLNSSDYSTSVYHDFE